MLGTRAVLSLSLLLLLLLLLLLPLPEALAPRTVLRGAELQSPCTHSGVT